MKKIAIIPARIGSKRIPKKNIKSFLGKPIIAYSIIAAMESGIYDEVMVSTDSPEIAKIAIDYGAKVPFFRSYLNSGDLATTVDVLLEVLTWYENEKKIKFDVSTCIYACAPFVNAILLNESFNLLKANNADCVFPAVAYSHPIQRSFSIKSKGLIKPYFNEENEVRTQDLETTYHDAGMFYTFQINNLKINKSLRTENTIAIPVNELNSQDIDSLEDWHLAELKYELLINGKI